MRVCVIRLDALGDTLLSTPAIRLLVTAGAEVTVLTHPVATPILRGLARTLEIGSSASARQIATQMEPLRPEAVLVFSEKRRSLAAGLASRAPVRVGFDPGLSQPLKSLWLKVALTHRVDFANRPDQDSGCHEVERYCRQVRLLFPEAGPPGPLHLEVGDGEREAARAWMQERGLSRPVALQLTPKWALHGVDESALVELAGRVKGPIVGFYGPAEKEWAETHFQDMQLCFQPDLHLYAALLAECRTLITVDTGAAHVGAAVGIPVVDVFPALNQAHCVRRWRPWQVEHRIVLSQPSRPQQWIEDISVLGI